MDDKARAEKAKALAAALAQIEKQFGKGSVMRMADGEVAPDIEVVSTGSLGLDIALGVGGLPRGRVVEIYGPESSGKTTLTLQVIAEMQKLGGTCAFIDAEHALDVQYAAKLGVRLPELLISQPDTGEQALEICDALVRSGSVDLVVVDSVAALTPRAEIEGDMGDALPGLQARLMSQALRKLTGSIQRTNTLVIFINQIRMKIGVMFGNPETTTGGNALKFYASVRLDTAVPVPSRRATRSSATRPASRSSRTRSRPRSRAPSSTSSTVRAPRVRVRSSIWASPMASWKRVVPGTATTVSASVRARTTPANTCARNRSWRWRSRTASVRPLVSPPAARHRNLSSIPRASSPPPKGVVRASPRTRTPSEVVKQAGQHELS